MRDDVVNISEVCDSKWSDVFKVPDVDFISSCGIAVFTLFCNCVAISDYS